jgi:hypothetical protein
MKMLKNVIVVMTMMMFAQLGYAAATTAPATTAPANTADNAAATTDNQKLTNKLQTMKTAIGINGAEQQKAWDAYQAAALDRADTLSKEKAKMKASREADTAANAAADKSVGVKGEMKELKVYTNSALDRMEQKITYEKLNVKTLEKQKVALHNLYKTLTPEQKKIVDQQLKVK